MSNTLDDVFADTVYWLALVVRQDAYHVRATEWTKRIRRRIITTDGVLIETTSALATSPRRSAAVKLVQRLRSREDIEIIHLDTSLLDRGWRLYCDRLDKSWSWVDCTSFIVMQDRRLREAMTADHHFVQAGFRAVLLEAP
ncbi:MAG: PIN domain-containing protein [Planctomycetota bacterium]